jgi:hypothetical protein
MITITAGDTLREISVPISVKYIFDESIKNNGIASNLRLLNLMLLEREREKSRAWPHRSTNRP